ncbi:hypothetical protein BD779DRAFT_1674139 [Infundibulicybe gibba]|nr:hypothetical protein BD779DRAFT_1674139 [Infundibulicybe gibba]
MKLLFASILFSAILTNAVVIPIRSEDSVPQHLRPLLGPGPVRLPKIPDNAGVALTPSILHDDSQSISVSERSVDSADSDRFPPGFPFNEIDAVPEFPGGTSTADLERKIERLKLIASSSLQEPDKRQLGGLPIVGSVLGELGNIGSLGGATSPPSSDGGSGTGTPGTSADPNTSGGTDSVGLGPISDVPQLVLIRKNMWREGAGCQ